jgi:hypothetical protein
MRGLRWTAALTALLVLVPAGVLVRWPRPRAQGLERLLGQAALLQSFPATPGRPVPALWSQRLGADLARSVWRQQRRVWWQFWGRDGDGGAFLAFPVQSAPGLQRQSLPPHSLRVDDLVVVAPDPLSQRLLQDQLKLAQRQRRGLEERCLKRLQTEQAVFWSPLGLGVMAGTLAPLLQRFQEGCLTLRLQGASLGLAGEASAASGLLAGASPQPAGLPAPLPPDLLLEWRGPALEALVQGLLSRQLIREPLAARYGIGEGQLALLRRVSFVLRLRPLAQGPFQAGLELQLAVAGDRRPWTQLLAGLVPPLEAQGLEAQVMGSASLPARRWRREDGQVVGGWRWVLPTAGTPQLVLYLGPEPRLLAPTQPTPALELPGAGNATVLRARPQALAALGLLPPELPLPVQQAGQLDLVATSAAAGGRLLGSPLSQLTGRLQWQPRPQPQRPPR